MLTDYDSAVVFRFDEIPAPGMPIRGASAFIPRSGIIQAFACQILTELELNNGLPAKLRDEGAK
jgi:hypothetical protein